MTFGQCLVLQSIIFFVLCKGQGKSKGEAIAEFVNGETCRLFGLNLTYGQVEAMAKNGGY